MIMLPFTLINFALFQLAWFSAALLRDDSPFILLGLLAIHFWLTPTRQPDGWLIAGLVPIGLLADGLLVNLQLIQFNSDAVWLPVWMVLLWIYLVISLNHSLGWLLRCPVYLQGLVGALAGAGSYLAAERLGALSFNLSVTESFLLMACIWALQLPLFAALLPLINRRNQPVL